MFPLSSKSFSTGSEPLTYCRVGGGEWEREKKRRGVSKAGLPSMQMKNIQRNVCESSD